MAEAVVSVLLETLGRWLGDESRFLSGVSPQVESLVKELRNMQCFLKDADAKQCRDESIRNSLREIRNLSYRIEDLIESYGILAKRRKSLGKRGIKRFLKRSAGIFGEIRSVHKFGADIEKIKGEISSITANLQRYNIIQIINQGEGDQDQQYQQWVRQTYAHKVDEDSIVVGLEDDIKNLVSLTISDVHVNNIISIWGMGGLGKTTLAREVYNHGDLQKHFERFGWTCMTQQHKVDVVLADLLTQLLPEKNCAAKSMTDRELVRQLHQVQKESKCFIVIDDIWEVEHWKSIEAALSSHGGDSILLLTTRNEEVAMIGNCHKLEFLSDSEGWELLQQIASNENTDLETDPCFKEIGLKLVSKCGGLPLAICLLGGILKDKSSSASWEMVNRHVSSYLNKMGEDGESREGSLEQVLSLSYNELPYNLKLCFLCFGCFKEDEHIPIASLYMWWITEGFISGKLQGNGETLEEVAERYLVELGRKCMVQLKWHTTQFRKNVSCSLHDVMRDF